METAIAVQEKTLTADQIELIKRTVAKGASNDELKLFLHIANKSGLDPFARQIHAIKRWSADEGREVMAVQTGIDGYRLVAERTGRYAPGREPSYQYNKDGFLVSATAYVKKQTSDGTWHEVAASAMYSEYVGKKKDGSPNRFWAQMPHVMLGKVAEALALRRAFPMELSGIYTYEEMDQAKREDQIVAAPKRKSDPEATAVIPMDDIRHYDQPNEQDNFVEAATAEPDTLPFDQPDEPKVQAKSDDKVSEAQAKRLFAIAKKSGFSNDQIKEICLAAGYGHSKDIRKRHYEKIVESFDIGTPEQTSVIADFIGKWVKEN